jgi:hypothetical protein
MEEAAQTDQRKAAWATLVVFVAILFWVLGYNAAKFANDVPIELDVMDAMQFGCLVFLAGYVLRHRRWLL